MEPGIRWDSLGIEAYLCVHRRMYYKRFHHDTPLEAIRQWRQRTKAAAIYAQESLPILQRGSHSWCYVYCIASSEGRVKIGKSIDAESRLAELRRRRGEKLTMMLVIMPFTNPWPRFP